MTAMIFSNTSTYVSEKCSSGNRVRRTGEVFSLIDRLLEAGARLPASWVLAQSLIKDRSKLRAVPAFRRGLAGLAADVSAATDDYNYLISGYTPTPCCR
jgi:molybdopterin biosynthesis enzyme